MENKATLENSINALAALFSLSILHKENQRYLIRQTNTIHTEFLQRKQMEQSLNVSFVGSPNNMPAFQFWQGPPFSLTFLELTQTQRR